MLELNPCYAHAAMTGNRGSFETAVEIGSPPPVMPLVAKRRRTQRTLLLHSPCRACIGGGRKKLCGRAAFEPETLHPPSAAASRVQCRPWWTESGLTVFRPNKGCGIDIKNKVRNARPRLVRAVLLPQMNFIRRQGGQAGRHQRAHSRGRRPVLAAFGQHGRPITRHRWAMWTPGGWQSSASVWV